jgi:hypothetical protein
MHGIRASTEIRKGHLVYFPPVFVFWWCTASQTTNCVTDYRTELHWPIKWRISRSTRQWNPEVITVFTRSPQRSLSWNTLVIFTASHHVSVISSHVDHELEVRGIGFPFPAGERDFSVLQSVQTGSEIHSVTCSVGTHPLRFNGLYMKLGGGVPPLSHIRSWHAAWSSITCPCYLRIGFQLICFCVFPPTL